MSLSTLLCLLNGLCEVQRTLGYVQGQPHRVKVFRIGEVCYKAGGEISLVQFFYVNLHSLYFPNQYTNENVAIFWILCYFKSVVKMCVMKVCTEICTLVNKKYKNHNTRGTFVKMGKCVLGKMCTKMHI